MRFAALISILSLSAAFAGEAILDFDSAIGVRPDGTIEVTETIRVRAEGREIKRGIYRDFPTLYKGPVGLRIEVPFRVVEILRDGRPEPWHTAQRSNGTRISIGSQEVLLPEGETTYTIRYETGDQLGFFEDYDELYWNVTGSDWAFPIEKASACVTLPPGATVRSEEAFTGPPGARGNAWRAEPRPRCDAFLQTTSPLPPGEGFTIAVTWPKGFVQEPPPSVRASRLFWANRGIALGVAGLLLTAAYFGVAWSLFGKDPERGIIVPLYEPPKGMDPQDLRYLNGLGTCDNTSFSAAVLHLAVLGHVRIHRSPSGTFTLHKEDQPGTASPKFLETLFGSGGKIELTNRNHKRVSSARTQLQKAVKEKNRGLFECNTHLWVVGLVLALIPLGISLMDANEPGAALFMVVWLSIWSVGCAALLSGILTAARGNKKWSAVPLAVFSIPFFGGWIFGLFMLVTSASPWVCAVFIAAIGLCALFHHLLKRPTTEGQRLRDEILGFRKYLSVAEADRLNLENPPERTPAHFEAFLPYALALGVENQWSEQFSGILEAASYEPQWATGRGFPTKTFAAGAMAAALGSGLSGAISSASSAPGSRSGSGGGGSSGGGGGGGGGGGW